MSKNGTAYSLGQYNQILKAFILALPKALEGTDPKAVIRAIDGRGESLGKEISKIIEGFLEDIKPGLFFSTVIRNGYVIRILEDVGEPETTDINKFELFSYREDCKVTELVGGAYPLPYIRFEEVQRVAKEKNANQGYRLADYLLNHQEEIPVGFRKFTLLFPGTVFHTKNCGGTVADLEWNERDQEWQGNFEFPYYFGYYYHDEGPRPSDYKRLLRLK